MERDAHLKQQKETHVVIEPCTWLVNYDGK